ncbi:hypothetical protein AAG570_013655 [Ranatra chinensis]|uniref:Uncharacterized protein n=1 Tax=Ranatra chinensis TaxID=642074 RepID=A0ABD0YEP9_9HEMI
MVSKRRNMFYQNKKQETTEIGGLAKNKPRTASVGCNMSQQGSLSTSVEVVSSTYRRCEIRSVIKFPILLRELAVEIAWQDLNPYFFSAVVELEACLRGRGFLEGVSLVQVRVAEQGVARQERSEPVPLPPRDHPTQSTSSTMGASYIR